MVFASQPIIPFSACTFAADGPQLIAQMLFDRRNLCLNSKLDIVQTRCGPAIRGDTSQNPGAAFLVHDLASAIYRIDYYSPDRVVFRSTVWQHYFSCGQSFGDQQNRSFAGDFSFKELD